MLIASLPLLPCQVQGVRELSQLEPSSPVHDIYVQEAAQRNPSLHLVCIAPSFNQGVEGIKKEHYWTIEL